MTLASLEPWLFVVYTRGELRRPYLTQLSLPMWFSGFAFFCRDEEYYCAMHESMNL